MNIKQLNPKWQYFKNKQLYPNRKTFDEVPNESEYYKRIKRWIFYGISKILI